MCFNFLLLGFWMEKHLFIIFYGRYKNISLSVKRFMNFFFLQTIKLLFEVILYLISSYLGSPVFISSVRQKEKQGKGISEIFSMYSHGECWFSWGTNLSCFFLKILIFSIASWNEISFPFYLPQVLVGFESCVYVGNIKVELTTKPSIKLCSPYFVKVIIKLQSLSSLKLKIKIELICIMRTAR